MNLLKIQDALKNASDDQLMQLMQAPDSSAPSYLVLSEIRRRKDMRAQQQQEPETTVAEDLAAPPQTYADEQGIRSLRTPGYEAEEQAAEEAQQFRSGGIVRMAEGDVVQADPAASYAPGDRVPTLAEVYQRNAGLFPDMMGGLRERMQKERIDPAARKNEAINLALVEAGLRMAASKNPSFLGAVGEGAAPAVQSYTQQAGQIRAEQRQGLRDEMDLAKQEITRQYMVGQISAAEHRNLTTEIGANNRLRAQLAGQAANTDRTIRAQEEISRRALDVENLRAGNISQREGERLRQQGYYTPQEWLAMSPEQRSAVEDMLRIRRTEPRMDVAGIAPAMASTRSLLSDLNKQLEALGPAPREETGGIAGFGRRRNPEYDTYIARRDALQGQINEATAYLGQLRGQLETGRPRTGSAPQSGATPPVAGTYSSSSGMQWNQ
jgi:hypothetical protein